MEGVGFFARGRSAAGALLTAFCLFANVGGCGGEQPTKPEEMSAEQLEEARQEYIRQVQSERGGTARGK